MSDKYQLRVTGAVRIFSGLCGMVGALCFAVLGWWIAAPLLMLATWRATTGLGLLVTGRLIVDVD